MYCDVLWHWVLFWFHLMRYFTHQRKISKKYGPFFSKICLLWRQSYFEVVFNFLYSRAAQEYCAYLFPMRYLFGTSDGSERFQIDSNDQFREPSGTSLLVKQKTVQEIKDYKNLNAILHCLWSHWGFLLRNSRCDLHVSHCN